MIFEIKLFACYYFSSFDFDIAVKKYKIVKHKFKIKKIINRVKSGEMKIRVKLKLQKCGESGNILVGTIAGNGGRNKPLGLSDGHCAIHACRI